MSTILDGNIIPVNLFSAFLVDFTPSRTFVLKGVQRCYRYIEGKKTDEIEAVAYDVVDVRTFACFRVKVAGNQPVVDIATYEKAETLAKIKIPTEKAEVHPYRVEFGRATCRITAPYVELVEEPETPEVDTDFVGFSDFDVSDSGKGA